MLAIAAASSLQAQTNFITLVTNGPAANRLNIVFLAEGYTSNQFNLFFTHATNTANILLTNQPFAEYRSYFNVYAIAVASAQSGSDRPVDGIIRNTYFNSTYGNGVTVREELISIPPNWTNGNYSQGQGRVDNLLQTFMPGTDLAVMLVNDLSLGGSDGAGKVAITSIAPNSLSDIPVHESGHVLANLGDEYTTPNPGYPNIEEPNTTRATNRALIKWNAWITPDTPVPTPPTFDYQEVVGLFEGAHYNATGWYRPKLNCRMGNLGVPFCEVCREALVLSFYRKVRLVDVFSPASTNLFASSPETLLFTLTTLQPIGHSLDVQWLTNGIPIVTATNATLAVSPASLNNGLNVVAAVISDATPFVRSDPQNLLRQTVSWTVNVNLPALDLSAPRWLHPNQFAFRISGVAPQGFAIQTSTNLTDWTSIATNFLVNGQLDYTNQMDAISSSRLFRAVTPPR